MVMHNGQNPDLRPVRHAMVEQRELPLDLPPTPARESWNKARARMNQQNAARRIAARKENR